GWVTLVCEWLGDRPLSKVKLEMSAESPLAVATPAPSVNGVELEDHPMSRGKVSTALAAGLIVAGSAFALPDPTIPPPSSITRVAPPSSGGQRHPIGEPPGACSNARVNSNPSTFGRPQVEPGVASNPANLLQLVAGFGDYQNSPPAFDAAPGVALSLDGGESWFAPAGGAIVPNPPGFIWGNRFLANYLAAGDSAVAWGLGDTVYFSTLGFHANASPPGGDCAAGGLYVYRSDDGGEHWTLPAAGPAIANTQTVFRDKEYIAADANPASPFAGNVYMTWDDDVYSGCPQDFGQNFVVRRLRFSISSDSARTWSAPILVASGCVIAPIPAVAADGDVYVAWYDCNVGVRMLVRKSTNGGVSFGSTVVVAAGLDPPPNPLIGSNFRVNAAFPSIATDPTDSDNVYVTWSSNNGASQTDVFVSRSLNGGASWSPALRVNDDPIGNPRDQFFPWMSVGADGTVRIIWGDDRLDLVNPGGKLFDIFMAESTDQGASFSPNFRVTTTSSNPDFDGFGGTFIGDYFGLSASGVPVWDDMRNFNQDIYGAACPAPCPWDLDGTGSVGILDLLALLAVWGTDPGGPPDFDGDGTVGILDLLTLLANWGPCP
ncbi:MAG: hypothetical protein O6933_01830, partial [Planctomycetota bacterium]|nr:hypothetical protein [Planctomycetota bacterium]